MNDDELVISCTEKIISNNISKLREKEIDAFIEGHWLEWAVKYGFSPLGDLTVIGKREYIHDNIDEIRELISEFPDILRD